jgi:hypothetical protein
MSHHGGAAIPTDAEKGTAYHHFSDVEFAKVKAERPDLSIVAVGKEVLARWKALPPAEQAKFDSAR